VRIEFERKINFDDVVIRPKRSALHSRAEVDLTRTFKTLHNANIITGIPIIASNMDTVGTPRVAEALQQIGMFTALHKYTKFEECFKVWSTFSFQTFGLDAVSPWLGVQNICLDVANGYTEAFVQSVQAVRHEFPDLTIMAGNVATADMTEALLLAGADIVKVGVGPGSACLTTEVTGVGYPQLSAIIECADAAHGLRGLICADGGCKTSGDIVKAFAAGADFVMLGGMLAGHTENIVRSDWREGDKVKYYGMSSADAMEKYVGGVAEYRAAEGKVVEVPFRGDIKDTVKTILGGLRSACTYVGAATLKELPKRTTFVRVK